MELLPMRMCLPRKKGKDIVIPFTRANSIEVFQRIEIEDYPFRYVVFVVWLKHQENAYQRYQIIDNKYSHCIPTTFSLCLLLL